MDFNNKYHGSIDFFGLDVWITDTTIATWIIGAVLIALAIYTNISVKKFNKIPKGFQNFIEFVVETMDNFVVSTVDKKYSYLGGWFFGVMAFILFSNLSGLVTLRPPTADLATTFALSLMTFFLIHFLGISKSKGEYFKGYADPYPFLVPINIIGEVATPVSLSFRLFGNILGGLIIMGMVYELFPFFLKIGVPAVLHVYFDIFAGALQSFIFVILSMTFIRSKLPD